MDLFPVPSQTCSGIMGDYANEAGLQGCVQGAFLRFSNIWSEI